MRKFVASAILFAGFLAPACFGELSVDQRLLDFQSLAAVFSKDYAFYEWKRDAVKFDGLDLAPWLTRVRNAKTDLEFWNVCAEYVASFQDSHTFFLLPSSYSAWLGISVDIYEGKVMVDSVDANAFTGVPPVNVGDELVSLDGKLVADLIQEISSRLGDGNSQSRKRYAATMLVDRGQAILPSAHLISEKASLMIHRPDGSTATVELPWIVSGTPYTSAGPVPTPRSDGLSTEARERTESDDSDSNRWPRYMRTVRKRQEFGLGNKRFIAGLGELKPIFTLPETFTIRRGALRSDTMYTGSFTAGGSTIGYLRIADFSFISTTDLQRELAFFSSSTDGLIIDMMRNPGGSGCLAERLASAVGPDGLRSLGVSLRVNWSDIVSLQDDLEFAKLLGASAEEIAEVEQILAVFNEAFKKSRGMTSPLPICSSSQDLPPYKDRNGTVLAYSKPVMVLVDGFTASAAELFSAILQDNKRALIYGSRTDGAGGLLGYFPAGVYGEAATALAIGIAVRAQPVVTTEFPAAPYIENIGVRPDQTADYQTMDNLLHKGKPFVDGFVAAMLAHIEKNKQQ